MKKILAVLLAVFVVSSGAYANTTGVSSTGNRGLTIAAPGLQLTTNAADPTDGDLASGRLSVKDNVLRFYNGSAWADVTTGTAGTADSVYNAGAWTVAVDGTPVKFVTTATGAFLSWAVNVTGTTPTGVVIDAQHAGATITDALLIYASGNGTITDGIDVSDTDFTYAINLGANTLKGGLATIDFTEFDVSGTTGAITINDGGDAGSITIESTVLDINSLDFVGAGAITAAASSAITINPNAGNAAGEDLIITAHNLQLTATGAITLSPDAAVTTALTITDTDYTNALSVGDNNILGTTGTVVYTNWNFAADGDLTCVDITASGNMSVTGAWLTDAIAGKTTDTTLTIDANGTGGITLAATSTGAILLTRDTTFTGDIDIDGGDITCPADLVITPAGGQVDISVGDLHLDSGKKLGLNGATLTNNFLYLSTNVVLDAAADIVLDPGGGDIDCDAATVLIDSGEKLSVNGSTETATVYLSTDLLIDSPTDIRLSPTGGEVDVNAAHLAVDEDKYFYMAGIANTNEAALVYTSSEILVYIDGATTLEIGATYLDVSAGDVFVDSTEEIGLNGTGGAGSDRLYLNTDVILDATADIVLDAAGGQVDVSGADIAVDAGEHVSLAGITTIGEAAFIYQNSAIEAFVNEVNTVDFLATHTLFNTGTCVFNGGQTRKEVLQPSQGVILDGTTPPSLTSVGTDGVANKRMPAWAFTATGDADDHVTLVWNVPDGYVTDSARLNVGWSFSDAETNDDDVVFDMAVTACNQGTAATAGDAWDVAGTAFTEGDTNIATGADADKLMVTQLNFEILTIEVDDTVLITFWVDSSVSDLDASTTCDIHFFEIEWESTE